MKRIILFAVLLSLLAASFHYKTKQPRPMRVILNDRGFYYVERRYGIWTWSEMGGPYTDLTQALAKASWWRTLDSSQGVTIVTNIP